MRRFTVVTILIMSVLLAGCETLKNTAKNVVSTSSSSYLCDSADEKSEYQEFCELSAWTSYLLDADALGLSERQESISNLGNSPKQQLQKVLLSQAVDTPYRQRLRAQNRLTQLKPAMGEKMVQVAEVLVERPSQQILELESAISILTRMNAGHEKSIEELQDIIGHYTAQIEKQRRQVEQLLSVETEMSDEKRSN